MRGGEADLHYPVLTGMQTCVWGGRGGERGVALSKICYQYIRGWDYAGNPRNDHSFKKRSCQSISCRLHKIALWDHGHQIPLSLQGSAESLTYEGSQKITQARYWYSDMAFCR